MCLKFSASIKVIHLLVKYLFIKRTLRAREYQSFKKYFTFEKYYALDFFDLNFMANENNQNSLTKTRKNRMKDGAIAIAVVVLLEMMTTCK